MCFSLQILQATVVEIIEDKYAIHGHHCFGYCSNLYLGLQRVINDHQGSILQTWIYVDTTMDK